MHTKRQPKRDINYLLGTTYGRVPGGILEIYMTGGGGPTEPHFLNPKKYSSLKFTPKKIRSIEILYPKKYLASKFYTQKIQDAYT